MVTYVPAPVKNNSVGSSNIPGVGETGTSTFETVVGNEIDSSSPNSKVHGIKTTLGRMTFTETDTGVTVDIENAKASFSITKSGDISLLSTSGSGISVIAPSGKVSIHAVEVLIKSTGSMSFDSGADINLNAKGSINLTSPTGSIGMVAQSMEQNINGLYQTHVTKEMNTIVGGHMRTTIGGESRIQVSGKTQFDIGGNMAIRSTGELILNSSDSVNIFGGAGGSSFNSKGTLSFKAQGNADLQTKGELSVISTGNSKIHSSGIQSIASTGAMKISSSAGMNVFSSSNMNVDSGGHIHLANGGASQETVSSATDAQSPEKAQVVETEMIQNEISTIVSTPSYPYNAKRRSNAGGSRMRNRGAGGANGEDRNQAAPWKNSPTELKDYNGPGAKVEYANGGATRNKPISKSLEAKLSKSVAAVYGPGAKAVVYSGGQDEIGTSSNRTGSIRHDNGLAGDVYVYRADGSQVRGNDLSLLGQYWLANNNGSVGMEMHGGGIHLDEWGGVGGPALKSGMGRYWYYGNGESQLTKSRIQQGAAGSAPDIDPQIATGEGSDDSATKLLPKGSTAENEIKKNTVGGDKRLGRV